MAQTAVGRRWVFGVIVGTAAALALALASAPALVRPQPPKEEVEDPAGKKPPAGKPTKPMGKPGAQPPKEEVETTPKPATPPPGPAASGDDLGPKIDLGEAAKSATHPEIVALFKKLQVPHDEVDHNQKGTFRIKPVPECLVDKPNAKPLKFEPLDSIGTIRGATVTAATGEIRRITPYELVAVRAVDEFLKSPLKNSTERPNPRLEQLAAAETALTAALQFHKTAGRTGEGWDAVQQQVRDQLLTVQVARLHELAEANRWDEANALLAKLHRVNPDSAIAEPEIIRVRLRRFEASDGKGIPDDDVGAIRTTLEQLARRYPPSGMVPPNLSVFRQELPAAAVRLRDKGMKNFEQGRTAEGVAYLRLALALAPELLGLEDELRRRTNDYPILYVGVPRLPELMSPAAARFDSERQAAELLFESLVQAVPDVRTALAKETAGLRWRPVLGDDTPRLLTLGREVRLVRGAAWGGGQPGELVTANDVAGTMKLYRDLLGRGGRVPAELELLKEPVVDEQFRLRVYFAAGFVDPLELLSFKVLPADKRLAGKPADDEGFARRPVGSGPYQLVVNRSADGQERVVVQENGRDTVIFRANPAYSTRPGMAGPPARPVIREIRFVQCKDPIKEFKQGELHLLVGGSPDEIGRLQDTASNGLGTNIQIVTPPSRRIWILAINHSKPLLQGTGPDQPGHALRRLIGHAINRKKVLDDFFRDGKEDTHKELTGPFPADCWATPKGVPALFNLDVAQSLAAQRLSKQGQIRLTLLCPDDTRTQDACRKGIAAMIEAAASGVKIDVKPVPLEELLAQVRQPGQYDLAYLPYDYRSDLYFPGDLLNPSAYGGLDVLGYHPDPDLEALLRDVRAHTNFAAVRKRMNDLHLALVGPEGRMPFVPLWQLDTPMVLSSKLQLPFPPDRLDPLTVFTEVEEWKLSR